MLKLVSVVLFAAICTIGADDVPTYKMCVPHKFYDACVGLMKKRDGGAVINCVSARDRMECIDLVNKREADFMAVDPEDMYVAYQMKNEDFAVISEIRTVEEPNAEFRYEGIILVKKNSDIKSLNDLKGKKSCHTGYGRNVGYKIPITKLRKLGLFKPAEDVNLPAVERELKGLSELFSKSCLVGKYSSNAEYNQLLKKRYKNLCELCENPDKCDYPDKYSGYDGSIRCLVDNGGDVAFTKVIYVRKHFGLSINGQPPKTEQLSNPDDYEYLCEDGTRRPITGQACSWAQRPWQGYMTNGLVAGKSELKSLQERLQKFYTEGQTYEDEKAKKDMWISDKNLLTINEKPIYPEEHLVRAKYKDVIEREGAFDKKLRLCVKSSIELEKCDVMRKAAYSRDIRPQIECIENADCYGAIAADKADVTVVNADEYATARSKSLKPVVFESLEHDDLSIVLVLKELKNSDLPKIGIDFDATNPRSKDAAMNFYRKLHDNSCASPVSPQSGAQIKVINAKELRSDVTRKEYFYYDLLCTDFSRQALTEFPTCHFETTLPTAIFTKDAVTGSQLDAIIHIFTELATKFGHGGKIEDVFEMFNEFKPGQKNVLFHDYAKGFVTEDNSLPHVDEETYNQIHCKTE